MTAADVDSADIGEEAAENAKVNAFLPLRHRENTEKFLTQRHREMLRIKSWLATCG